MPPRQAEPEAADVLEVSSAQQYSAFGHPLRLQLMIALGEQPATVSQLAARLGSRKGNIAHHLKVLREAGLVRLAHTRHVRGGTERYFERSAHRFDFVGESTIGQTGTMLRTVAQALATTSAEPFFLLRHIRLTTDQLDRLTATLTTLARELVEAPPGQPRYGLLLGLYRDRDVPGG